MRWRLAALLVGILAGGALPAFGLDFVGFDAGFAQAIGKSSDFAGDGTTLEARWRHQNRGRTSWELVAGYVQTGLEGEIQNTIADFDALVRAKNREAQRQGGPGDGFLVAEYGIFETFYGGANVVVNPWKRGRLSPFASFGGGIYNWRVPFRLKFYRTPFFGEQHAYLPAAAGAFYAAVIPEEALDFTKQSTTGGVNVGLGSGLRLTARLQLAVALRVHLLFSSGDGNREEGIDDQDYLDEITFALLKGGFSYRF